MTPLLTVIALLLVAGLAVGAMTLLESRRRVRRGARKRAVLAGAPSEVEVDPDSPEGLLAAALAGHRAELTAVESAMALQEDRLRMVMEHLGAGLIELDEKGQIEWVDPSAAQMLGLPVAAVGRPLGELVPELRDRQGEGVPAELVLGGSPLRILEVRLVARGEGRAVVLRDVTELRRLEVVRRDFVANVSHELRTPISVIRANAETLTDGALQDPVAGPRFLRGIERHAERLSVLVADLLDLSRIEAGRVELELVSVPVEAALARGAESVDPRARERGVRVAWDAPAGLAVRADVVALDQVLVNLLDNAVKYATVEGGVRASARSLGTRVRIEVQDDGPGVASHQRARLFERFYRVDDGRSRQLGGTGLGLAIVKNLVGAMGGTVGLEPAVPHGAIFWVELPEVG